jgi:hypothetical protein
MKTQTMSQRPGNSKKLFTLILLLIYSRKMLIKGGVMFKRKLFFTTFVAVHLLFVFLQIHKHTQFIHESYRKQRNDRLYTTLLKEKDSLIHKIHTLHNKEYIRQYAQTQLRMTALNLRQIKKVSDAQPH